MKLFSCYMNLYFPNYHRYSQQATYDDIFLSLIAFIPVQICTCLNSPRRWCEFQEIPVVFHWIHILTNTGILRHSYMKLKQTWIIYRVVTKRYGTNFRTNSSHLEDEIMLYEHGSGNAVIQQHFKAGLSFHNGF
jgi:hypothetical protein